MLRQFFYIHFFFLLLLSFFSLSSFFFFSFFIINIPKYYKKGKKFSLFVSCYWCCRFTSTAVGCAIAIYIISITQKYTQYTLRMAARVSSIFVYPVKSCRGISVPQAPITPTGKTDMINFFDSLFVLRFLFYCHCFFDLFDCSLYFLELLSR